MSLCQALEKNLQVPKNVVGYKMYRWTHSWRCCREMRPWVSVCSLLRGNCQHIGVKTQESECPAAQSVCTWKLIQWAPCITARSSISNMHKTCILLSITPSILFPQHIHFSAVTADWWGFCPYPGFSLRHICALQ